MEVGQIVPCTSRHDGTWWPVTDKNEKGADFSVMSISLRDAKFYWLCLVLLGTWVYIMTNCSKLYPHCV